MQKRKSYPNRLKAHMKMNKNRKGCKLRDFNCRLEFQTQKFLSSHTI